MIPQRWIEAYLDLLLRRRHWVILAVALITGVFAYALKDLQVRASIVDFYPPNHPYIQFYRQFRSMFGGANVMSVILEVRSGDIYTPATLQKLDRITKFMIYTKGVVPYQVTSIADPKVRTAVARGFGTINLREIFFPGPPQTQEEAERVRFRVHADRGVRGVLVATDDTAAVVQTAFWEDALDAEYLHARMAELVRAEEDAHHRIYITGLPWLFTSIRQYTREIYVVFGCTILSLAFWLYAYFRTWTGIWLPLFSGLLSTVWGLGMAAALGFALDPLLLIIPMFLTARALSHSVQSMDRYHEEFSRIGDQHEAIVASYAHLFPPAIAAIVTDGLTLLVTAIAPIPLIQKIAVVASFWVVSILVSVVTLHPILLSYLHPPAQRREALRLDVCGTGARAVRAAMMVAACGAAAMAAVSAGLLSAGVALLLMVPLIGTFWVAYSEAIYSGVTGLVVHCTAGARRWAVVGLTLCLFLVLPVWAWKLKVGDMSPGAAVLFPTHPYNLGYDLLNQKFLGASQLVVMADSLKPDGLKDDRALNTIDEFADHMRAAQGASAVFSIADVYKQAARLWRDGDPKWGTIPAQLRERTELLFMVGEMAGGARTLAYLTERSARYAAVVTLFHTHSHDVIMNSIRWAQQFGNSETMQFLYAGGLFGVLAAVNESVERAYWLNLGLVFVIVYLCLYLTYRSLLVSTILMIPVVLSQLAAEAFMVFAHIDLNVNSLPVAAAGAGVGVDYGIYHFSRMLDAYDTATPLDTAVDYATRTTGKAIIFTAGAMMASTIFWWFSHLKFLAEMGLLLSLLMAFNTLGGLIMVPAFVKVLGPRVLVSRHGG